MRTLILAIALLVMAIPAEAKVWTIDTAKSKITFAGMQMGRPFGGIFSTWQAVLDFDPDHPETAKIDVTIKPASASTGDKQRDEAMPMKDWFDVAPYPEAKFHLVKLEKVDDMHFDARGQLTIKNKTVDVSLPFTFVHGSKDVRLKGETDIDRTKFDVGVGEWASEQIIAHKVSIDVDLVMN